MIEFRRQTATGTRMDQTQNINIFLKGLQFGVFSTKHWGDFSEPNNDNPMIQLQINDELYTMRLEKFKKVIKTALDAEVKT